MQSLCCATYAADAAAADAASGPTGACCSEKIKDNVVFEDFKKFVGLSMYFRLDANLAQKFDTMHKETFKNMLMNENLSDGKPVCARAAEDLYTCLWHIYKAVMDERKAKPIMDSWLADVALQDSLANAAGPSGPSGSLSGPSVPCAPSGAALTTLINLSSLKKFLIAARAICDPGQLNQSWNAHDEFDTPAFKTYIKSLQNPSWPMVGFEQALEIFEYMRMCWY